MEFEKHYEILYNNERLFICEGNCDGVPTIWVTKTKWNGKFVAHIDEEQYVSYTDEDGNEVYAYEEWNEEYKLYTSLNQPEQ